MAEETKPVRELKLVVSERQNLKKKTRFDVFKRDDFTCMYCGQKPPTVVLEVDHVIPVSQGGTNDLANLATSCFDCNHGKSDRSLGLVPETALRRAELLREREEQERAFARLLRTRRKRLDADIDAIERILLGDMKRVFATGFRLSVKHFLEQLPMDRMTFAAERAYLRIKDPEDRLKYFCGICWKLIRERP